MLRCPDCYKRIGRPCAFVCAPFCSITDCLIASNGLVSEKLAGRVRYMDSTKDEQVRGITMKSSSITLIHRDVPQRALKSAEPASDVEPQLHYIVNLIDSPGHIDFSSDVSTAVRLCDGALVVIDALEGLCSQTHVVLKHAWAEGVQPCLLLNKIDRLVLELQLTPMDAYQHLRRIIEQVNVIASQHLTAEIFAADTEEGEYDEAASDSAEARTFFSPSKGNVLFASAVDGWAFSLDTFAGYLAPKMELPRAVVRRALWGDWHYKPKTKKIVGQADAPKGSEPLFVSKVLASIWTAYDAIALNHMPARVDKIVSSLGLSVDQREITQPDPRSRRQALFRAWLPASVAILNMIVRCVPSPQEAQSARLPKLCASLTSPGLRSEEIPVRDGILACSATAEAPVVVFVSKMFAVDPSSVPAGSSVGDGFIGFARVLSGVLKPDSALFVMGPKYIPTYSQLPPLLDGGPPRVVVNDRAPHLSKLVDPVLLFMMMGRELFPLLEVPAGMVVGLGNLQQQVIKSATLSSTPACPSFSRLRFQTTPLVRVAVEPLHVADMKRVEEGLQLLNRSDPCVEVIPQENGELHLLVLGELHLERCINELEGRFAGVKVVVSAPILSFYETIAGPTAPGSAPVAPAVTAALPVGSDESDAPAVLPSTYVDEGGRVHCLTADRTHKVILRALPLPRAVTDFILDQGKTLKAITKSSRSEDSSDLEAFASSLKALLDAAGDAWADRFDHILAFGPKFCGPNLLVSGIPSLQPFWVSHGLHPVPARAEEEVPTPDDTSVASSTTPGDSTKRVFDLKGAIVSGFQLATVSGPLCAEPMWGACFLVDGVEQLSTGDGSAASGSSYGSLSGQVMSAVKDGCLLAFERAPMRLVEPMYLCELQCSVGGSSGGGDQMGKLYGVLFKRRGKVVSEDLLEGTQTFAIKAFLPVAESFGFANDLRKKTSGTATSPQLLFSHWEVLDKDPFFKPTTEDEKAEFGDMVYEGQLANIAKQYVDSVRTRKGIAIDKKIVVHAEKQRTLSKKK